MLRVIFNFLIAGQLLGFFFVLYCMPAPPRKSFRLFFLRRRFEMNSVTNVWKNNSLYWWNSFNCGEFEIVNKRLGRRLEIRREEQRGKLEERIEGKTRRSE